MWSFKQTAPMELFAVSEEWKMLSCKINRVQEEVMLSLSGRKRREGCRTVYVQFAKGSLGKWAR
jgi:hypothetical protein